MFCNSPKNFLYKRGLIASAFDLLHPGHLVALAEAKSYCEHLIAALHVNPAIERTEKNIPIETALERWIRLRSCLYVDEIIPYETENDLDNLINSLKIHVQFLGEEYSKDQTKITGYRKDSGLVYKFLKRDHDWSSTNLRGKL